MALLKLFAKLIINLWQGFTSNSQNIRCILSHRWSVHRPEVSTGLGAVQNHVVVTLQSK